jgi:glycosyltransferase involved in cell wall biosynthesis
MEKVEVLVSTYNGEAYIEEQLQSILRQTYQNITILIRDDGSSDDTVTIIQKYMNMYSGKIHLIQGSNVGVKQSFYELIQLVQSDVAYCCFCDQDDVWMDDKIERAIKLIQSCDTAGLYFSSTMLTNHMLNPIKVWPTPPYKALHFYNALVENIAVGATVVMNKAARQLIASKMIDTDNLQMHDWWAYLCVSAFGRVYYDERPSIYYRQHSSNVVGGHRTLYHKLCSKWRSFRKHSGDKLLKKQALEFHKHYGDALDIEKLEQLKLFIQDRGSLKDKYLFLQRSKLYRHSFLENQLFKFLILIDYI